MAAVTAARMAGYPEPVHQISRGDAKQAAKAYVKGTLGRRIRLWRDYMDASAESLARHADISVDMLRSIETGRATPSMDLLFALAMAMGMEINTLMFNDPPKK